MTTTDDQERQIENWLASDNVVRIDTLPHEDVPDMVKCHIFGRGVSDDDLELLAIGIINADASQWWLTSCTREEQDTIRPIAEEGS